MLRLRRAAFVVAWLAAQALLVATAGGRIQHAFGFRMFEESSTVAVHVERLVDGGSLPIGDAWQARDCAGVAHTYRWRALVPAGPTVLDVGRLAPYGADAAVAQARAAVAWVAAHTPDDCDTPALVATVRAVKNGRPLPPLRFTVVR
jgi:hypothetical protein